MSTDQPENRRRSQRIPAHLIVVAQPLSKGRIPYGPHLDAVSIDLSQGGICFISDHPLLTDLAILEMQAAASDHSVRLLAERVRCRRVGPMFEIAMRFIEKMNDQAPVAQGAASLPA